jgi:hypothetical protein
MIRRSERRFADKDRATLLGERAAGRKTGGRVRWSRAVAAMRFFS